ITGFSEVYGRLGLSPQVLPGISNNDRNGELQRVAGRHGAERPASDDRRRTGRELRRLIGHDRSVRYPSESLALIPRELLRTPSAERPGHGRIVDGFWRLQDDPA